MPCEESNKMRLILDKALSQRKETKEGYLSRKNLTRNMFRHHAMSRLGNYFKTSSLHVISYGMEPPLKDSGIRDIA